MAVCLSILKTRIREWFSFDSRVVGPAVRGLIGLAGFMLYGIGVRDLSFRLMSAVHRAGSPLILCRLLQEVARRACQTSGASETRPFDNYFRAHIATAPQRAPRILADDPERFLKSMAIVVASAHAGDSRGVIIVNYNYAFPLFAKHFNLKAVAERYHIVLEPSWSGYFTEDLLCYTLLGPTPVFVQAYEQRDRRFIDSLGANLVSVPLSTNWWVDCRIFTPDPQVERDLDFVMAASWADFKRHHRFFDALRKLRRNGHRLQGACIGYPAGLTLDEIKRRADWYGVADQIEFYEFVPQSDVAQLMNRAKVNVVWSRKEGVNRVIIEGMFCDTPCLLPDGFNYGYRYPYINEETGRYSSDRTLPGDILEMTRQPWPASPAQWVHSHMTPQHSTKILETAIGEHCLRVGEAAPEELIVKIDGLHGMDYWDAADKSLFEDDYQFLRDQLFNVRYSLAVRP